MKNLATPIQGFQSLSGSVHPTQHEAEQASIEWALMQCVQKTTVRDGWIDWNMLFENIQKTFTLTLKEPQ